MKIFVRYCVIAAILACMAGRLVGEEIKASVTSNRVNVRGQATLESEVITQLHSGETVIIVEQIAVEKPAPGEPTNWAKILLPSNTPVWISTLFVDAATKTVKAAKLNVRAGPGEQFSVVARLVKGDTVREIRTVDDWMEIEPPAGTVGYVAAELLNLGSAAKPPAVAKTDEKPAQVEKPKEMVKAETPKPVEPVPITVVETINTEPPPAIATDLKRKPAGEAKPKLTVEPIVAPPPVVTPPPTVIPPAPKPEPVVAKPAPAPVPEPVIAPAPPAKSSSEEPAPKRIVEREGIVKRAWSIQAPSGFALVNETTSQTINYLYASDTGLQLKYYLGKRIRITGQESLDSRWARTPLISIQTLETIP